MAIRGQRRKTGQREYAFALPLLLLPLLLTIVGCDNENAHNTIDIKSVRSWQLPPDNAKIPAPRAVTIGPNDDMYVLDDDGRVVVMGDGGVVLNQWSMPESSVGNPEGICCLKDGRVVVADTHYDRLVFFSRDGTVLQTLGSHGTKPGQFVYPVAVCQDDQEFIYVAEYGDHQRVQKFTPSGEFVLQFGKQGTEAGQFQRPSGVVWRDGQIYVVDAFNNRVQLFKDDGTFVGVLNDKQYELQYPYDVTKAPDGTLYIVEHRAGRISHMDAAGKLLGRFGMSGRTKGKFITPWGIAFRGRSKIVVADTGNRRLVEIEL